MEAEIAGVSANRAQSGPKASGPPHWWQPRELAVDETLRCQIGPLALAVGRGAAEWRLAWTPGEETEEAQHAVLAPEPGPLTDDALERHVVARSGGQLRLRPLLLDRPVVTRPRQPIFIPAGEATTLYLSSPVCISVDVESPAISLREIPSLRLSDTWFGPSTREGELCYSGRTRARYNLAELPQRDHRAITPVRIENHAKTTLPLEKLSLPLPALSVYGNADGHLWTEGLTLSRRDDSDLAALRIDASAPGAAGKVELISSPRRPADRGGLVRAFSLIFGS